MRLVVYVDQTIFVFPLGWFLPSGLVNYFQWSGYELPDNPLAGSKLPFWLNKGYYI
jgi:hypothetical protein